MDASQPHLTVVLPAYNEEASVGATIEAVLRFLRERGLSHEVVVVDDGSEDATASVVARVAGRHPAVRLVRHPANRGYGAALRTAFAAARGEWVFFMDADGQFDVRDLGTFLERRDGHALVIGYRAPRRDPLVRRINAAGWNWLVRVLLGVRVQDVDCAFKLIRADVLRALAPESEGPGINAEMLARARRLGHGVLELPVRHLPRRAGRATGARPDVILRGLKELARIWWGLRRAGAPLRRSGDPVPRREQREEKPLYGGQQRQESRV